MIYIIHGDDTLTSRKRLSELIANCKTEQLEGKTLTVASLEEKVLATGLFGDEKYTIVDNLFSKNPNKAEFIKFISSLKKDCNLIIWEDKKLDKNIFSKFNNVQIEEYLLPTYYFKFLDSISPKNKKQVFELYHKLLAFYSTEQVFYSLIKRIRQLVILASGSESEDLKKMATWQKSNLKRQLATWREDALLEFYDSLKDTEIKLKTGDLPVSLSKHLDILILSKLT